MNEDFNGKELQDKKGLEGPSRQLTLALTWSYAYTHIQTYMLKYQ